MLQAQFNYFLFWQLQSHACQENLLWSLTSGGVL